jgi:hypothetical protein
MHPRMETLDARPRLPQQSPLGAESSHFAMALLQHGSDREPSRLVQLTA